MKENPLLQNGCGTRNFAVIIENLDKLGLYILNVLLKLMIFIKIRPVPSLQQLHYIILTFLMKENRTYISIVR